MALPLVHAARHNDVKPLSGRELMILTHDDDDDVCMYRCGMMASNSALGVVPMHWRTTTVCSHCGLHLMGMYVCMFPNNEECTKNGGAKEDHDCDVFMYVCMFPHWHSW